MRKAIGFGVPKEQAILSATVIPAKQIDRKEIGVIAPSMLADFVVCSESMEMRDVFIGGNKISNYCSTN